MGFRPIRARAGCYPYYNLNELGSLVFLSTRVTQEKLVFDKIFRNNCITLLLISCPIRALLLSLLKECYWEIYSKLESNKGKQGKLYITS